MHILFVLENYWPNVGGVETLFRSAAEELARRGHRVTVITSLLPATSVREVHDGVTVRRVRVPQFLRRYLFMAVALPATIREAFRADVIHTTTYNAAIPAWIAGAVARRPRIITVHEVFSQQWQSMPGMSPLLGWGYRIFEWMILRLPFKSFVCDSDFTRRRLHDSVRLQPEQVTTIYPSHDAALWRRTDHSARELRTEIGLPPETFIYLYFGRPGVSKGVHDLIEAVPLVRASVPGSRLVMLLSREPADQYDRLRRRVRELGIQDEVLILDSVPRSELPSYLLSADCIVVPSISEGFGYAALEAATLGCRVIATAGHSVEEILAEVVTLVPPRDREGLAAAIISAASETEFQPVEPRQFTVDSHVDSLLEVYKKAMKR